MSPEGNQSRKEYETSMPSKTMTATKRRRSRGVIFSRSSTTSFHSLSPAEGPPEEAPLPKRRGRPRGSKNGSLRPVRIRYDALLDIRQSHYPQVSPATWNLLTSLTRTRLLARCGTFVGILSRTFWPGNPGCNGMGSGAKGPTAHGEAGRVFRRFRGDSDPG